MAIFIAYSLVNQTGSYLNCDGISNANSPQHHTGPRHFDLVNRRSAKIESVPSLIGCDGDERNSHHLSAFANSEYQSSSSLTKVSM